MVNFGVRVQTCDSLSHAKFCKNCLRELAIRGQIYNKNAYFDDFLRPRQWNFAHMCRPGTFSPTFNFVRIAEGILDMACRYCIASEVTSSWLLQFVLLLLCGSVVVFCLLLGRWGVAPNVTATTQRWHSHHATVSGTSTDVSCHS